MIKKFSLPIKFSTLFVFSVLIINFFLAVSAYAKNEAVSSWLSNLTSITSYFVESKAVQSGANQNPVSDVNSKDIADKSLMLNGAGFVEINGRNKYQARAFTIEAWVKYVGNDKTQGIIHLTNGDNEDIRIEITKEGILECRLADSVSVENLIASQEKLLSDRWHHIAVVFNEGNVRLFVDGSLSQKTDIDAKSFYLNDNIKIGVTVEKGNKNYFTGLIDELRIANFAKYQERAHTDKKTLGALLDKSYSGLWRFENNELTDYSEDKNDGKIVGKAWFSDEVSDENSVSVLSPSAYCGTTPADNSVCRTFDELPGYWRLENIYNDVSFYSNNVNHTFVTNNNAGTFTGVSFPNKISGWYLGPGSGLNYFAPLTVHFAVPVDNLSFRVVGLDAFGYYAQVQIVQQNGTVSYGNLYGHGSDVPVDYYFGMAACGNGQCNRITEITIFNITDNLGISYDNFSYTPSPANPTPTPPATPTPSPTPSPVAPPRFFVVTPEVGKVKLNWQQGLNGDFPADSYKVYRSSSQSGEELLATVTSPLEYIDKDVKIKQNRSYKVVAVKGTRTSVPTSWISKAPLSPCDQYPGKLTPDTVFSGYGWTGTFSNGLTVADVKLNGRMLASLMHAAQYINVKTNKMAAPRRLKLYSNESQDQSPDNGEFLSKSIGYNVATEFGKVTLNSEFCVSSPSGQAAWTFNLKYVFGRHDSTEQCEPSATLPCSRFFPLASYKYESPVEFNETSQYVEVAQKLMYRERNKPNSIGLFQDCEDIAFIPPYPGNNLNYDCSVRSFPFSGWSNPVPQETNSLVLKAGFTNHSWDNIHSTSNTSVDEPSPATFSPAGCPSCVHDHWRWAAAVSNINPLLFPYFPIPIFNGNVIQFRNGQALIGWDYYKRVPQSQYGVPNQDVEVGLVVGNRGIELDPLNYRTLVNDEDLQRHDGSRIVNNYVDYWYAGTSKVPNIVSENKNTSTDLFHAHGGFFNPILSSNFNSLIENKAEQNNKSKNSRKSVSAIFDGPISVVFEYVYQNGTTSFTPIDISSVVLPPRYTAVANSGYKIETTAVASGDHTITFNAQSVSSSETFANLRILQAQFDPFNPLVPKWADVTILPPEPQAPDFPTRTIKARTEGLGKFIIAVFNPALPLATTNLKVELTDSPDPIRSDNTLTYSLKVSNISNTAATSVIAMQTLPPNFQFVSASPGQGTCRLGIEDEHLHDENHSNFQNRIFCQLGIMPGNTNLTIPIVVIPTEGEATFPPAGMNFSSAAAVTSAEPDTDGNNNTVQAATFVLPSLNTKPSVTIAGPVNESTFISSISNPTPIPIVITAADIDGSITKVEVFDNGVLLGAAASMGGNQYGFTISQPSYGYHFLTAKATDNGGRAGTSANIRILVNGTANLTITTPTQNLFQTGQHILIETSSTVPTSRVQKVELFSSGVKIGTLRNVSGTGSIYKHQFLWTNAPTGKFDLIAVLTEYSGAVTISNNRHLTISNSPSVIITNPSDGITYQQTSFLPITVELNDTDGYVEKVAYYINGGLIGTTTGNIRSGSSTFNWQNPAEGIYSLVVVATDDLGVAATSAPITFGINRPVAVNGELIWVDDQIPTGAAVGGDDGWNWLGTNPASLLGSTAHQSLLKNEQHEHYFENASQKLPINPGEKLTAWIFLDPRNIPSEIMLQFNDGQGWEHRAYWGDNLIALGTDATASRKRIGNIPAGGRWTPLIIPANLVGLEGKQVNGIKFTLFNGRAAWDRVGKLAASASLPQSGDFIWVEDEPPVGSTLETVDDTWNAAWISNPHYSGNLAHRHYEQATNVEYRQHAFKNPINSMYVDPGDTLFTYVYLNPDQQYKPDTLVLQWYDDISGWSHRAYWGVDSRDAIGGNLMPNTESWRYMGEIPTLGTWVRLEIPAGYVGLEGRNVKGMAFGMYQKNKKGRAVWDYSGKTSSAPQNPNAIANLKYTTPLWRYHCDAGTAYRIHYKTQKNFNFYATGCQPPENSGYIYSYEAPGTIPLYIFEYSDGKKFLSICPTCGGTNWVNRFVIGYVPSDLMPNNIEQKVYSCNNNYYYTTWPELPSNYFPTGCTFQFNSGYRVHTGPAAE
jgi:uncharacterized repeat protein (TIGR01451 family)